MTLRGFLCLEAIVEKMAKKHAVSTHEVEQVVENDDPNAHFRFVERGFTPGEDVYSAMGQTRRTLFDCVLCFQNRRARFSCFGARYD